MLVALQHNATGGVKTGHMHALCVEMTNVTDTMHNSANHQLTGVFSSGSTAGGTAEELEEVSLPAGWLVTTLSRSTWHMLAER